jgi:hypothetical protein
VITKISIETRLRAGRPENRVSVVPTKRPSKLVQDVTLLTCVREMLGSNLGREIGYLS